MSISRHARIFVAGHGGLVGSAIVRSLSAGGHDPSALILRTRHELDLRDQDATYRFFEEEQPEYVFMAAAIVGGIHANNTRPAEFIRDNLLVQNNVIDAAWRSDVRRLLFLGSSCIYPRMAPQPIREESLLTGPLEPTNRPYALAKISGIEMCWSYNRQYGTKFLAAMPTNLYGPNDNYDLNGSHVIPALIRKFHEAKLHGASNAIVWGSGNPRREFMYSEDMAEACVHLMSLEDERYEALLGSDESVTGRFEPPIVNIGTGQDVTIAELAQLVSETVGFEGKIVYDTTKPDGTPRKLLDVSRLSETGWHAKTPLREGLKWAYKSFLAQTPAADRYGDRALIAN